MKTKVVSRTSHFLSIEDLDVAPELSFHPDNTPTVMKLDDRIVVGYLCQDEDCQNPLEDCDGMGHIRSFSHRHINNIDPEEAQRMMKDDPDIVPLSYFEHGQCLWDVLGGARFGSCPDQQWDGVRFAGIWIPDDACREHIEASAATAKATTALGIELPKKNTVKIRRRLVAVLCAEQACREYTNWCNGDCWGVCVDVFDLEGKQIDEDACWGYIGSEYAEKELAEQVECYSEKELKDNEQQDAGK